MAFVCVNTLEKKGIIFLEIHLIFCLKIETVKYKLGFCHVVYVIKVSSVGKC